MRAAWWMVGLGMLLSVATGAAAGGIVGVEAFPVAACDTSTDPLAPRTCVVGAEAGARVGAGEAACHGVGLAVPAVNIRAASAGPGDLAADACVLGDAAGGPGGAYVGLRSNPFPFTKN